MYSKSESIGFFGLPLMVAICIDRWTINRDVSRSVTVPGALSISWSVRLSRARRMAMLSSTRSSIGRVTEGMESSWVSSCKVARMSQRGVDRRRYNRKASRAPVDSCWLRMRWVIARTKSPAFCDWVCVAFTAGLELTRCNTCVSLSIFWICSVIVRLAI